MITYEIQGINDLIRDLDDISKNQLPFGTAAALTRTAQDAQTAITNKTYETFIVRTGWPKPSTPFGIKIIPARKDTQQAVIYNVAPFMMLQETGGRKVTVTGRKYLAIPTSAVKRTKRELIARSNYPSALMQRGKGGFIARLGSGKLALIKRSGKGRTTLTVMYTLQPEARIKPAWGFEQTGIDTVDRVWKNNWYIEMGKAIAGAK